MTRHVVFRRAATIELYAALDWYEAQRRGLGDQLLGEVEQAVQRAAGDPDRYPEVRPGVRRALCRRFPFAVFYRVRDESLIVIAVFHARRDPRQLTRRQ